MLFLTDFGDQGVILPLALGVAAALAYGGWRRGAVAWLSVVAATLFAVLVGKLLVDACGPVPLVSLKSPSGHTAASAVVYGGLLALLAAPRWHTTLLAAAGALAAAAAIGGSRLALGAHSRSDVAVGAALGIAGAVLLTRLAGPRPPWVSRARLAAVALAMVIIFHGTHLHAENDIARVSRAFWPLTLCLP